MLDPFLLILPEAPRAHDGSLLRLFNSLERLDVSAVCFTARALNGNVPSGKQLRWAESDPALRWLALKNLLDHNKFSAVGYIGARTLQDFSERIADHAPIPAFVYLGEKDLRHLLSRPMLWMRRLTLALFPDQSRLQRFKKLFPGLLPFRTADADRSQNWPSLVGRPVGSPPSLSSLITPVYNRVEYTLRCARSVLANTPASSFEWIFIDNGSSDATARRLADLARKNRRIRIIRNKENLGFACAVNQGLRKARGQTLLLLNNDTLVPPGWLEGLNSCLEHDPGLGAVGPCTNEAVDLHQHRNAAYGVRHFNAFAVAWSLKHSGRIRPMHRLIGFCLALRRQAYEQVGLLDERFRIGGYEDYDYCLRLRQAGWRLGLAEEVFIHHFGHVSYQNTSSWRQTSAANREVFLDKWTRKSMEFLDNLSDLKIERV